ncbi:MAG: exosortase O, partial [Leptolyngbyaceae cyanobacterium bins.59]|nr:exosortase O [Leptolyngbyaceae cyanobacterium bins.59]
SSALAFRGGQWTPFTLRPLPVGVMAVALGGSIALQNFLRMPQLLALCCLMGTYGLLGFVLAPIPWRKGLPVALLIACLLPFSTQFGSGLGFPARVLTAQVVQHLLATWKIAAVSSHDIIVLENGIAHVDLPCSGLKSLWTGTLVLLAATWLDRRSLGWKWLLVCLGHWFFLVSANISRVLILVWVGSVLRQPTIANILHVPLGLLGFIGACTVTWFLLRWVPDAQDAESSVPAREVNDSPLENRGAAGIYAGLLVGMVGLAGLTVVQPGLLNPTIAPLQWPAQVVTTQLPLTDAEKGLFASHEALLAEKYQFQIGDLKGSLLVVGGTEWGTYHAPELCFVGNGLEVNQMQKTGLTPDITARWLVLQDGRQAATYWFQSAHQTTDEWLTRVWDQLLHRDRVWVMVSVLFDRSYTPQNTEISQFASQVHHMIRRSLTGGEV